MLENEGWSLYGAQRSQLVATGGKWEGRRERLRQAKTVAVGCDQLPELFHGKEGVDGSSPSEGSEKLLQMRTFSRSIVAAEGDEGRTCRRYSGELRFAASEKPLQRRQLHDAFHADPVAR